MLLWSNETFTLKVDIEENEVPYLQNTHSSSIDLRMRILDGEEK